MNDAGMIYVHIPFCVKKCDYCDFVSGVCEKNVKEAYFKALKEEIVKRSESAPDKRVGSVFFGGGTPSIVDAGRIKDILDLIRGRFEIEDDAEITIEANPNSVTADKLKVYREAGINRISIGLQSSKDDELKTLGRVHTFKEFLTTYDLVRSAGFSNVNIDIMSAVPGQTLDSYHETLKTVATLNPEHISAYSLIVEEGTPFFERYKDGAGLPDEDTERNMYYDTESILKEYGYERYEISNYARPGYECKHNMGYWTGRRYMGFGVAAASYDGSGRRTNTEDLNEYIAGNWERETIELSETDKMEEFMFLGLRMTCGISKSGFKEAFGKDIYDVYNVQIERLKDHGLIIESGDRIFLSKLGTDVANTVMAEFMF